MASTELDNVTNEFLQGLLKGDRAKCSALAHEYLAQNPSIKDLYEKVFKVALYEVGKLWENNKITVATEHMATAITEGILNELFEQIISSDRTNKKVVVACVEGEKHQVGIKMVADMFEMKGWESFFLGPGIPTGELIKFIHQTEPHVVAISLSIYFNYANLVKMVEAIRTEFPEILLLVGGQAFTRITNNELEKIPKLVMLSDLNMLEQFIDSLNRK
ncbi:MAG TPA: cobalamin-dependent protein [Prolixibacteraceae bacterium]|nr:cobalamin-dependent protein [Prolixibacteraceae bacterium]HPR61426.1 cobalamin-dependent protein [Prolixibacteraceae bacterium]